LSGKQKHEWHCIRSVLKTMATKQHQARDAAEDEVFQQTNDLIAANEALAREVSERKRTERALRRSQERFDLAVRGTDAGIWDWDLRTNRVYFSPRWKSMLGYEEHEIDGDYVEWERRLHPEDRQRALATIRECLEGRSPQYSLEHRLRHKDGHYCWIHARGIAVRDAQGRPYRMVGSHIDITVRKCAEQSVMEGHRRLRRLLEMHEKERKIVAYEIHDGVAQSLAGARMILERIGEAIGTSWPEEVSQRFCRALDLVNTGLVQARQLIHGQRPLTLDDSGLSEAIELLVCQSRERGGPAIEFHRAVRLGPLAAPLETAIYRIVQEALTNALRYSGGDTILVRLGQRDDSVLVDIEDNGSGFDPADVRPDSFGLEGIRVRAQLFEGRAEIASEPGKGTHVHVELPLVADLRGGPARRLPR
jgi:two-component system sensor histidine kinase UhpB